MSRKKSVPSDPRRLEGLAALGQRLRQLRRSVGLSQMKLSEKLGFNPAHGYKYIVRLEKGQIPNPTLRTIAAVLASCGADWPDIADVLPTVAGISRHQQPRPVQSKPSAEVRQSSASPSAGQNASKPPEPVSSSHSRRPARHVLRKHRIERLANDSALYWARTRIVEQRVHNLLDRLHIPPPARTAYIDYTRALSRCLSVAGTPKLCLGSSSPLSQSQVAGFTELGLDKSIIKDIEAFCTEIWSER